MTPSSTLAIAPSTAPLTPTPYTRDQIDLIKRQIAVGVSDDELRLFLYQAQRTGLDPLARQIYAIRRGGRMTIQTAIDGFRLIAQRTGEYRGQQGPYWCSANGIWADVWLSTEPPVAAKVGVWRKDFQEPVWGVARTAAYAAHDDRGHLLGLWRTMADTMIAKCAEALALRKAFPHELSGVYTGDEMDQSETVDHETGEITPPRPPAPAKKPPAAKPAAPSGPQYQRAKVLGIVQRPAGADGRVKFLITCDDQKIYSTLKLEHAEAAKAAQEAGLPIEITYLLAENGARQIQAVRELPAEPIEDAEPPV